MRVRMIETRHVKKDPYHAFRFDAGKTFYLPNHLAQQYINQGVAMEDKSLDEAPEKKTRKKKKVT